MKKLIIVIMVLTMASGLSLFPQYQAAAASAWQIDYWNNFCSRGKFSTGCHGYYSNQVPPCIPNVCSAGAVLSNGINVNSIGTFVSTVQSNLTSGNTQNSCGAAFIIDMMLGHAPFGSNCSAGKTYANANFSAWQTLVQGYAASTDPQYGVQWNVLDNPTVNSSWFPDVSDDVFHSNIYHCTATNGWCGGKYRDDATTGWVWQTVDLPIPVIRFFFPGGTFEIERGCANLVGSLTALPPLQSYTITGRTTVSSPTVLPGQSVTFKHYLKNSGPNSATINWATHNAAGGATLQSGSSAIAAGLEPNVNNETFTVPANTAFGTQYCRYIAFSPAQNGTGSGQGATVCTQVVAQFGLTPIVTPSASTAQPNDTLTFTYSVTNSGPTQSTSVTCKAAGQTSAPGYTPLPQQDADRNPAIAPQPGLSCGGMPVGNTVVGSETITVGNIATGSKICRSLVVNPRDQGGGFRSSAESCVVIAKSPYVQFMGNDVWAGGNFAAVNPACTSTAKIQTAAHTLGDGTIAGSAVEYAAFALGKITTFGSANKALVNPAAPAGKALTFSNRDSNNLGFFGAAQHCINDYVALYDKATNDSGPAAINVGTQASGTRLDLSGPRSFSGTMQAGSQQIYLVEGDVTITGDIKYPATYGGVSAIPSLLIIATGNITVNRDVQQLDGMYVTRGQFFTCDVAVSTTLSVNPPCEKQLVVNGAVLAGTLRLLRTFGAEGNNDTLRKRPAELFNFSPELYLNNALTTSNALRTVDEKDLPPRF